MANVRRVAQRPILTSNKLALALTWTIPAPTYPAPQKAKELLRFRQRYSLPFRRLVLVSSDADYLPLINDLRDAGVEVHVLYIAEKVRPPLCRAFVPPLSSL